MASPLPDDISVKNSGNETASPDMSIMIVAFNSRDCIAKCLHAIGSAMGKAKIEILLIDNGDDGTAQFVTRSFPDVTIVPSIGNVGFAHGNNRLAKHASGTHIVLLNPDAFVEPAAFDALLEGVHNYPEAGAWGGVTLDGSGRPDFGNAIPIPSLREFLSSAAGRSRAGRDVPDQVTADHEVDTLSGGFMMVRRSVWEEMGGFDERFFLYCEEVDLCLRLQRAGYGLHRIAAARAEHQIAHGDFQSPRRRLFQAAGTMEFLRKHWAWPERYVAAVLMWIAAVARLLLGKLLGWRSAKLAAAARGYHYVALRPDLWLRGYHPQSGLKAKLDQGALALRGKT